MRYSGVASCEENQESVPMLRRDQSRQSQRQRRALCHTMSDRPSREVLRYDVAICKTIPIVDWYWLCWASRFFFFFAFITVAVFNRNEFEMRIYVKKIWI